MARWLVAWTLFISVATTGSYAGTNALIAQRAADPPSTAMLPLADGGPGTSAGRRAQRARLDAFLTRPLGILSFDTNDVGEAGSEHPGLAMRSQPEPVHQGGLAGPAEHQSASARSRQSQPPGGSRLNPTWPRAHQEQPRPERAGRGRRRVPGS